MDRVTTREGVEYGFDIFGYVIILGVATVVLFGLGLAMADSSPLIGGGLVLVGVIVGMAGIAGLQFKIIADAVAAGMVIHEDDGEPRTD